VRAEAAAAAQLLSAAQRAPIPDLSVLTVRRVIQSAFVQMRDRLSASATAAVTAAALQVPTSATTDASNRAKEAKAALAAYDASVLVLPHSDLVAPDDAPADSASGPLHQAVQTLRATPPKGCVLAMSAECTVAHGVAEFPAVFPLVLTDRAASAVQAESGMRALARRAVAQLKSTATATTPSAKKGAAASSATQTSVVDVVSARDAAAEAAAVAVLNGGAQFEVRISELGEADGTSHQGTPFDGRLVLPFELFAADV
jgi:histone H3/H4